MTSYGETVVELDMGLYPEPGAPAPLLAQGDFDCFLVFHAVKEPGGDIATGVVEVVGCEVTRFGYPNDEALPGHPLWRHGLDYYTISEVINSSWIAQLSQQNRVAFPDHTRPAKRHFIVTFHDSTFECIADKLEARIDDGSRDAVFADVANSIR